MLRNHTPWPAARRDPGGAIGRSGGERPGASVTGRARADDRGGVGERMADRRRIDSVALRACACLLAAMLAGCAVNPATGRTELVLMSRAQEAQVGREAAAQVAQLMGLVQDPELTAYVGAVGARVARQSPRQDVPYQFQVVDIPEPNAFALPGGYVYVSRGLLAITNSEDELANVLGHEIAHVAARHAAQRQTTSVGVGILSGIGSVAAAAIGGEGAARSVAQLGQTAGAGLIASYGRDQEREADLLGQRYAAGAGADPMAMAEFLGTLERATTLENGQRRQPGFFDTHPSTPERVANSARNARATPFRDAPGVARDRNDFLRRLDGLVVGQSADEGVVDGRRLLHPVLDFQLRFPEGWEIQNGRNAVLGVAPGNEAALVMELEVPARSAREAAAGFVQRNGVEVVEAGEVRLGAGSGFRVLGRIPTDRGPLLADLTWILHGGQAYRLTGLTAKDFRRWQPAFASITRSFRPLTPDERESIQENVLRVVAARAGETLPQLVRRTGSRWSANEVAVANAIPRDAHLEAGQMVKVAVGVPFRSRRQRLEAPTPRGG